MRILRTAWTASLTAFALPKRLDNSRLRIISVLSAIFVDFDSIFYALSKINPAVETIVFVPPMIFNPTVSIFFVLKNFIFHTTKIFSGEPNIMPAP